MTRMTREQREDIKRQAYTANIRGMRPSEIAKQFNLTEQMVNVLLREARKERVLLYQRDEKEDEDGAIVFILDHIQTLRNSMFATLAQLKKGQSKSNNVSGVYSGLIHLVELEAKIKGLLANRITGGDGRGPVEIMAIDERAKMIEQLKQIVNQESELEEKPNLYLMENR